MQIYVQSCGISPNHDYIWLKYDHQHIQPHLLNLVDNLREKNAPSIIIAREGEELFLLISNLKTSRGSDYQNRPIFNSVAWIAQTGEEPFLRMLAARSLREEKELIDAIDQAIIGCDDHPGFKVLWDKIQELSTRGKAGELSLDQTRKIRKIGNNSQKLKCELAEELDRYCLPNKEGALVVVTGVVKSETLKNAGVWRSLSRLVDTEDWEKVTDTKDLAISNTSEIMQFLYRFYLLDNKDIFVLIIAILIALSVIFYPLPTNNKP